MQIQKKIIALAIASALTAPALALADATVYGQANVSVDIVNDGAVANSNTTNQLNSNTSRLGVKGSEDLGGGLSAIVQLEGTIALDSAGSTALMFNRDTFVGMSSTTMGTLLLGEHDTPYKMATRNLDMFADGIADNRGSQVAAAVPGTSPFAVQMMGSGGANSAGHDAGLGNVIAYVSPSMSGFSVAAAGVFGAETASGASPKKGSAYSLAGMYAQGPWYGTLAYQTIKFGSAATGDLDAGNFGVAVDDETKALKLGGSYTVDQFAVNAVIEKITFTQAAGAGAGDTTNTNYYLAGKYNVSSTDAVKLAYTKRGTQTAPVTGDLKNDASEVALGYDHAMSKNTTVYALYAKLTDNTQVLGVDVGPDPSVVSFGIRHSF